MIATLLLSQSPALTATALATDGEVMTDSIPDITQIPTPITQAEALLAQDSSVDLEPNEDAPESDPEVSSDPLILESDIDWEEVEISVTGTRTPRATLQSPANITITTSEELKRALGQDLRDLVRYTPGVTVNEDVTYGLTDINIRGLERNRVLIQVDGIRQPTYFEFGASRLGRNYLDIGAFQRIEILRGSASALYGSDALGGVVSFFTPVPADFLERTDRNYAGEVGVQYRSVNTGVTGTATFAFRALDNLEGLVQYTRRNRGRRQINADSRFADPFSGNTDNLLGKLVYRFNDASTLTLTGEYYRDSGKFTTATDNLNLVFAGPGSQVLSDRTETANRRGRISLAYEYDPPDRRGIIQFARIQGYYQGAEFLEDRLRDDIFNPFVPPPFTPPPTPRSRVLENSFVENIYGGEAQFRSDFSTGPVTHRLTYGVDISNTFNRRVRDGRSTNLLTGAVTTTIGPDNFPVKDFPDSDTLRIGVYLQDEMAIGQFTLIPGLRFDYYSLTTKLDDIYQRNPGAEASNLQDSALSPSLGLVYQATPEVAVVGRYARGFRAPTYLELNSGFSNPLGGYRTLSAPNLKPETSDTFEVGVRGAFPQARVSLTGFYSLYNNFIFGAAEGSRVGTDPPGCFPPFTPGCIQLFQSQNLGRVRIYGLEAQGEYRFSPGPDGFRLFGGLAWVRGTDDENDRPLETINPIEAVLGLGYQAPQDRWGVQLATTIVGKARTDSDPGDFIPSPYALVDLLGYYRPTSGLSLQAGIFNLFNTEYVRYADARRLNPQITGVDDPTFAQRRARITQPGINFGVSVLWEF
ncbi:TonB-dependent hemoglobin/transferrin/lactoferrin family receptor [Synechococcales cyanobacterium C]|uniref:TonB-dependent hemoglobin/transferrin/lactoferrin family receptor n=2 Tax=Petrachloros TaxID=2918834 RepID=A0A8K2A8B0_9CYAN|nr:TonB-dependent hemoglobin/transferrin/lactoferrin family receptor [Petrachloros mirabilis]NCJ07819.1 TonB-dependent hemoglobin/transferrin/lactoferrin family receptor [Petrachloros mirabilis ULC683]